MYDDQPPPAGYEWVDNPPPPPRAAPRIVVPNAPPPRTPAQQRIDQGNADAAPYEAPRVRSTIRNTETNTERTGQTIRQSNTNGLNFDNENQLSTRFYALPEVRRYADALPAYLSAREAARGGAGDLNIVTAYGKVMDPGNAVMQGEREGAADTAGFAERMRGYMQSISNGGRLAPEVRQRLIAEMENRVGHYRAIYAQTRKQFARSAEAYGFSVDRVIGPDLNEADQPGPNAPTAPGAPTAANVPPELMAAGNRLMQSAVAGMGSTGPQPQAPAINAPGGVTATDARESAQASQVAGSGATDTSGAAADPQMETGAARAYNEAWVQAVNSGLDRDQLNQWAVENAPRFFPRWSSEAGPPPPMNDRLWNAIEESRRTGRGLDWVPPSIPVSQVAPVNVPGIGEVDLRPALRQQYQDNAANARGAEDRRAFADEHPFLASIDTAGRQIADTATLGLASRISGTLSGRGAAYEHGITGEDWRSRPLESLAGTFTGGARLPYGGTLPRQIGAGAAYGCIPK